MTFFLRRIPNEFGDTKIKAGTWEALLEDVKVRLDRLISHMKESGTQCERVSNLMTLVRHVKEKHRSSVAVH